MQRVTEKHQRSTQEALETRGKHGEATGEAQKKLGKHGGSTGEAGGSTTFLGEARVGSP